MCNGPRSIIPGVSDGHDGEHKCDGWQILMSREKINQEFKMMARPTRLMDGERNNGQNRQGVAGKDDLSIWGRKIEFDRKGNIYMFKIDICVFTITNSQWYHTANTY